jgi:transcriptional regulator with XRE-family HTH domain
VRQHRDARDIARPLINLLVIARQVRGISGAIFARALGITQPMLCDWETHKHTPQLAALAKWGAELDYDLAFVPRAQADTAAAALAECLLQIEAHDTDYPARYNLVIEAMHLARQAGLDAGFGIDPSADPEMDGFRVVAYIELPHGAQVSWHMPEHGTAWDGHSTDQKYERCRAYARAVTR